MIEVLHGTIGEAAGDSGWQRCCIIIAFYVLYSDVYRFASQTRDRLAVLILTTVRNFCNKIRKAFHSFKPETYYIDWLHQRSLAFLVKTVKEVWQTTISRATVAQGINGIQSVLLWCSGKSEAVLRGGQGHAPCERCASPLWPPNDTVCKVSRLHNTCRHRIAGVKLHHSLNHVLCHPEFLTPNTDLATPLATPNCCS